MLFRLGVSHDGGGPQVIPADLVVDPGGGFGDGGQGAVHVHEQAVLFLDFGDYVLDEVLVYFQEVYCCELVTTLTVAFGVFG